MSVQSGGGGARGEVLVELVRGEREQGSEAAR
uniref:Uncharacterized protein n=1 Tax=Arundo donax TaxID=35708 RepID=A0A0A9DGD2_ARUDO